MDRTARWADEFQLANGREPYPSEVAERLGEKRARRMLSDLRALPAHEQLQLPLLEDLLMKAVAHFDVPKMGDAFAPNLGRALSAASAAAAVPPRERIENEHARDVLEAHLAPELERLRSELGDDEMPNVRVEVGDGEHSDVRVFIGDDHPNYPEPGSTPYETYEGLLDAYRRDFPDVEGDERAWQEMILSAVDGKIEPEEFARRMANFVSDDPSRLEALKQATIKDKLGGDVRVREILTMALRYTLAEGREAREKADALEEQIESLVDPFWRFRRSERLALARLGAA